MGCQPLQSEHDTTHASAKTYMTITQMEQLNTTFLQDSCWKTAEISLEFLHE